MLGGRGRTKRAVGSMRGKKISGLGALRQRKAARAARKMASRLGAVPTRGGRPTPRGRAAARQRRAMLKGARGRPRVQARRG